jgi:hypothetical protein
MQGGTKLFDVQPIRTCIIDSPSELTIQHSGMLIDEYDGLCDVASFADCFDNYTIADASRQYYLMTAGSQHDILLRRY